MGGKVGGQPVFIAVSALLAQWAANGFVKCGSSSQQQSNAKRESDGMLNAGVGGAEVVQQCQGDNGC